MPVQIFWVSPKIRLHLVPLQKLLCWHKKQFYWVQINFLSCTKCLWLPQYLNKFMVRHKTFGPTQNILGPVKGQSIGILFYLEFRHCLSWDWQGRCSLVFSPFFVEKNKKMIVAFTFYFLQNQNKRRIFIFWELFDQQFCSCRTCFTCVTKTIANLATYSRKPENYNGTIIFE